eukprot:11027738-Alexandrium_andersonii.AAC.1
MLPPQPSMGGRGPSSPNGPNGPLRGSESATDGAHAFQMRAPEAPRFARRLRRPNLQWRGFV